MSSLAKGSMPLLFCVSLLGGCATTHPVNYKRLDTVSYLLPNPNGNDRMPFSYFSSDYDLHRYAGCFLDSIFIYRASDSQFGDTSTKDTRAIAAYMSKKFDAALKSECGPTNFFDTPALRIQVTLTGVETNTPILSTLWKLFPVGLVFNMAQMVRDKQALFAGSVSYVVEIYDNKSNRLLRAYVAKQYPLAEDVTTSFGMLDAAKAGVREGAEELSEQLCRAGMRPCAAERRDAKRLSIVPGERLSPYRAPP